MTASEEISFHATDEYRFAGGLGLNRSIHNGPGPLWGLRLDRPGSFRRTSHFFKKTELRTSHSALRTGFTLIELLVVIAIISLLVSILLPSLTKAKELAKSVVCMNNEKGIGLSVQFYAEDFDDLLIPSAMSHDLREAHSRLTIHGYAEEGDMWLCPSAETAGWWAAGQPRGGGYAVNLFHVHPMIYSWFQANPAYDAQPVRRSDLKRGSEVLSFMEGSGEHSPFPGRYAYYAYCPRWGNELNVTQALTSQRHNEKNNVLFADGHIEPVAYDDIILNMNDIWGHYSR